MTGNYQALPGDEDIVSEALSTLASRVVRPRDWRTRGLVVLAFAQRLQYEFSMGMILYFGSSRFVSETSARRRDFNLGSHHVREAIIAAYTAVLYSLPFMLALLKWRRTSDWRLKALKRTARACVVGGLLAALAAVPARVCVELFLFGLFFFQGQSVFMLVLVYVAGAERYDAMNADARTELWSAMYLVLNAAVCLGAVASAYVLAEPRLVLAKWVFPTGQAATALVIVGAIAAYVYTWTAVPSFPPPSTQPTIHRRRRRSNVRQSFEGNESTASPDVKRSDMSFNELDDDDDEEEEAESLYSEVRRIAAVVAYAAKKRFENALPLIGVMSSLCGFLCNIMARAAFAEAYDDECPSMFCLDGVWTSFTFVLAVASCALLAASAVCLMRCNRSAGYLEACKRKHGGRFEDRDVEHAKDVVLLAPFMGLCMAYTTLYSYGVYVFGGKGEPNSQLDDDREPATSFRRALFDNIFGNYDSFIILIFVPLFDLVLLPRVERRSPLRPLQKLVLAGVLLIAAFGIALVLMPFDLQPKWLVSFPQYACLAASEIFAIPTFYELFYAEVPDALRIVSISLYMYALAVGRTLAATVRLVEAHAVARCAVGLGCAAAALPMWWLWAGSEYAYRQERDWTVGQRRRPAQDEIVAVLDRGIFSGLDAQYLIPFSLLKMGRLVASGGSGQVYKGKYAGFPVAIKMLYSQMMDPDYVSEVRHEARMLASVRHPHITQFHGISRFEKRLLLVTEFVPLSLDALVRAHAKKRRRYKSVAPPAPRPAQAANDENTPSMSSDAERDSHVDSSPQVTRPWPPRPPRFSVEDARRIWVELAQTLIYLHSIGLAHRDIKPSNMLLEDARDRRYHLKLCDLGMARFSQRADNFVTLGAGTPAYSPPESYQPSPPPRRRRHTAADNEPAPERPRIDDLTRWDVFSFATVIWYTWHCADPFPGLSVPEVCMAVARGERPVFDSPDTPQAPTVLVELANAMWHQLPNSRPSAAEILNILQGDELTKDILHLAFQQAGHDASALLPPGVP